MLKVETLEDERLLFKLIITSDLPYPIQQKIFDFIEEFDQKRAI